MPDTTSIMIKSPYSYARSMSDWSPCVERVDGSKDTYKFELRRAHIALLQEAAWEWDDNFSPGAPLVDAKRPFGNSGAWRVPRDIYSLLDDADPETLSEIGISDEYLTFDKDAASDSDYDVDAHNADSQALNGLWEECALALSIMFECASSGKICRAGTKWKISRDETWRPL